MAGRTLPPFLLLAMSGALLTGCLGGSQTTHTEPAPAPEPDAFALPDGTFFHFLDGRAWTPEAVGENRSQLLEALLVARGAVLRIGRESFEPTIGADPQGGIFFSALVPVAEVPGSPALPRRVPTVVRSLDRGATWEDVGFRLPAGPPLPPNTNDPYLHVDPRTGRIFSVNNQGATCSWLASSDDRGDSWLVNPAGCGHPAGGHDHESLATAPSRGLPTVGYDGIVYYCVNRVVDSACATSLNGGLLFGPLVPVASVTHDLAVCVGGGFPVRGGMDGSAFIAANTCKGATLTRTLDDGVTWTHTQVPIPEGSFAYALDSAMDDVGGIHVLLYDWSDDSIQVASSSDGGRTWTAPRRINAPQVNATALAAIAAGGKGTLAVAYYGWEPASQAGGLTEPHGNSGYNGYLSLLAWPEEGGGPTITVRLNPGGEPLSRGGASGCAARCGGVGDFIDVTIDPEGRPWAALVDVCAPDCIEYLPYVGSAFGQGVAGTLLSGPSLRREGLLAPL